MKSLGLLWGAQQSSRVAFQWGRIQSNADWVLPIAAFLLLAAFVRLMYRRDARELGSAWRWLLTGLRTATLFALLVLYLQPQWRTELHVVHPSRVVVLVDTSLSMGLTDPDADRGASMGSRASQVAAALADGQWLEQLRATHEVMVMRFDETVRRVALLPKRAGPRGEVSGQGVRDGPPRSEGPSPPPSPPIPHAPEASNDPPDELIDWATVLRPVGKETRLGQSLQQVIAEQRSAPLSGIVLVSDGCQNAGPHPEIAAETAREARIPIFTIGVGSTRQPANVRVYELEVPERAHLGDPYRVTGWIQSQGLAGQSVTVQLVLRDPARATEQLLETRPLLLGSDGQTVPVAFQVTPSEPGRRQVVVRVLAPKSDRNPADDAREAEVEIVERKNRVLLFAGGPSREYQFLKALLFRDRATTLDVLLQTAKPGVSQEAARILDHFPDNPQDLFAYDCIIAIDPQWLALNAAQVDLLEHWVAEEAGGLIVVAGPIYAGQSVSGWVHQPNMAKIRALYPVEFPRRATTLERETYVAPDPWPLDFTREGREAEFLWLADNETANQRAWAEFPGVYSCQPIRGPKPGATVYAYYSDPQTGHDDRRPAYLVGQFYGAGRVIYLGSGEMWRLRRVDESYFDRFYTRLVRHVAQGRLLRQSQRGSLWVDKERCVLGSAVAIRAQLTDARLKPLKAASVPVQVILPDRTTQTVMLRPDPSREGVFLGQLLVVQEGVYRLELLVPDSNQQALVRRIQVRLPDLERDHALRNDALLSRLASQSGGKYYPSLAAACGPHATDPLTDQLKDRTRTSIVVAGPNPLAERPWLQGLMLVLCALLCGEWLVRRLLRLA